MPWVVEYQVQNNNLPLLEQLEPLMRARLLLVLKQIGLMLEAGAKLSIQNQVAADGTAWVPLQEWYEEWKSRNGFSTDIYIMTASYMNAITHQVDEKEMAVNVGVMKDAGMERTGLPIWRVAEILEYGWDEFNVKIPPRPLWRPLRERNMRSIQTRVGIAIAKSAKLIEEQAKGRVL